MTTQSITETPNPLTRNIDIADSVGMARLFRQSDAQIFSGYDVWPGMMDEEIIEKIALLSWRMSRCLLDPSSVVLMSGAGTSGRLANLLCTTFNRYMREQNMPEVFSPVIAGGAEALIQAQESAEDNPQVALRDLKESIGDAKSGLYIGITCGLSAPYVASQLDFLGGNKDFQTCVVGFNPASLARDMPVENWDKTVKNVIDKALESDRFVLLNPVHGPESITGSTRMKGGSLTKVLLDIAFVVALKVLENDRKPEKERAEIGEEKLLPLRAEILDLIRRYQAAIQAAYLNVDALGDLIRLAGTSLRSGGRIHYIGRGTAGVLAVIDASECPPTFGADLYDVRGYLLEGWEPFGFSNAAMKSKGRSHEIDHEYFEKQVLPDVTKGDLVVGVAVGIIGENTRRLLSMAAKAKASTALIYVAAEGQRQAVPDGLDAACVVEVERLGFAPGMNSEAESALKVCLNALTTGGHILAGKVYGNVMIDLRISNNKLYHRSVGLISRLVNVSPEQARRALYHAVFKSEPTAEELENTPVTMYVSRAVTRAKVIPLAILLATRKFSYQEAEERLASEPRVRRIIEEVVAS
jgi:N-acetylmuramic acid 6-phosphate (MurNAc-6-P) etherase